MRRFERKLQVKTVAGAAREETRTVTKENERTSVGLRDDCRVLVFVMLW